jgi:hypothetical protein
VVTVKSDRERIQEQRQRLDEYFEWRTADDPRHVERGKAILADLVEAQKQEEAALLESHPEPWLLRKSSIAIDFDGVMHAGPWTTKGHVSGTPRPGLLEAVKGWLAAELDVVIFTCRALSAEGRQAVEKWLEEHGFPALEVTATKPHSLLYIDDRSFVYRGHRFPTAQEARNFRPWNKK